MTADARRETLQQSLQQAVALHQAGRAIEARQLYQAILAVDAQHVEARHNLGVLEVQAGQPQAGIPHLLAALESDPARAQFWLSYIDALLQAGQPEAAREVLQIARQQGLHGAEVDALVARLAGGVPLKRGSKPSPVEDEALVALFNQGRMSEVVQQARTMTEHYPQHGFGWRALGTALKQLGRAEEAIAALQQAAKLSPKEADVHSNLGVALHDAGRWQEAESSYRRALKLKPEFADAHCNLGTLLQEQGRLAEAETSLRRAIKLQPKLPEAHYNLGNTLRAAGRLAEAAECYRRALQLRPGYVAASGNLGVVLHDLGRLIEAEVQLRATLELAPQQVEAFSNLGNTLKELGRLSEAAASYRQALALDPARAETHNNLGILLQDMGDLGAAERCYREALQLKPDYFKARSNLLFMLNYSPEVSQQTAFEEAQRFGAAVTAHAPMRFDTWCCAPQSKRLRIGFVSGDLRNHPVGYFLENLLRHVDRAAFELYAYPTDAWTDETTLRLKSHFAAWHPLVGLDDEAAAQRIHGEGVHILIDLSGHSRYNRLPMFACKPAPVQVAWLGYFATTGVAEIDYLIADPVTLPESQERYFTEKIARLPETRLCFTQPDVAVEVSPLPALANGYVTFGCFNNLAKMNDDVVALWSRVLQSVAGSKLFLKSKQLGDAAVRQQTQARFAAHGIAADRLIMEGAESREKYFAAYHRVDIALDPFPYPGGTTTVESLWMGVPVLNLSGESFLFRQGAGFLSNAGLPQWVATSPQDYVEKAVAFAADLQGLSQLRAGLRAQVEASPIMDGPRFARSFQLLLQTLQA